jgi:hypothetical protein
VDLEATPLGMRARVCVPVQAQQQTKLLWVKTTPVPTVPTYGPGCNNTAACLNPPRFDKDVVLYNKAADTVMAVRKNHRFSLSNLASWCCGRFSEHA